MGNSHYKDRPPKLFESKHNSSKAEISDEAVDRSFVVVWCDASLDEADDDTDKFNTLIQLTRIVNKKRQLIHTFGELDECKDFIVRAQNICLIVSGRMGMQLVPEVHDLRQVHSIYIFCLDKPKYDQWAKQFNKIRGVHTEITGICDYLQKYLFYQSTIAEYEQLHMDVLTRNFQLPTADRQEMPFLYSILSKLILLDINLVKIDDMIRYCRIEQTSAYHQQLLDDLERNYSPQETIWWYTRDNFLQKIVGRALQIHDLFTLCMVSPFVQKLAKEITRLHEQQKVDLPRELDLYSCQSMLPVDLEKIRSNPGGLVCINQFLFANSDRAVPTTFLQHQTPTTVNVNALFQISITRTDHTNVSFANIALKSQFVHEKEFLISMSGIFRIEKVEPLPEIPLAWLVHVTLLDKDDAQFSALTQCINQDHCIEEYDLPELASSVTSKLYQFKSTRKLFEQMLTPTTKQIRSLLLPYTMGVIYDCLGEYDKAVSAYKFAIELTRQTIPNGFYRDDLCLVPLYSNMGLSYERSNKFTHAFDHAYRALNILTRSAKSSPYNDELLASTYFNLGLIHDLEKKFSEANIYYEHALQCRLKYLPNDHPDVINLQETLKLLFSE